MTKLLSRSKHEEFESNSSLQIRSQKEIRAKSEEQWITAGMLFLRALFMPPAHCSSCYPFLLFDVVPCLHFFLVSSDIIPVIAFGFIFFLVISHTLSTYISLSLYKL